MLARRHSQEITDLGTAIEVLVNVVLREAGPLIGRTAAMTAGTLAAPLRNQVEDHLGAHAAITVDLSDANNPAGAWWQDGYALRNRVLHEGHKATSAEVARARETAFDFIEWVEAGLRSRPVTEPVADALHWTAPPPPP